MNDARIRSQSVSTFQPAEETQLSKEKMEILTPMKAEQARKWLVHRWC
jgi:hypothetical protein